MDIGVAGVILLVLFWSAVLIISYGWRGHEHEWTFWLLMPVVVVGIWCIGHWWYQTIYIAHLIPEVLIDRMGSVVYLSGVHWEGWY